MNVNSSLSLASLSEQVAAMIGAFRNFELNRINLTKKPGRASYPEEENAPPYDKLMLVLVLVLVANRDELNDH